MTGTSTGEEGAIDYLTCIEIMGAIRESRRKRKKQEETMSEIDWQEKCLKVAGWLGEVRPFWVVTDDGGESMSFYQSESAPTKADVEDWLFAQQSEFRFLDSEVMDIKKWPNYHEDDAAAWRLHNALIEADYRVEYVTWKGELNTTTVKIESSWSHKVLGRGDRAPTRKALVLAACDLIDKNIETKRRER